MPPEPTAVIPPGRRRFQFQPHGSRLLVAVGLAVITYALFPEAPATQIPIYEVGAVATDNVIAPFAYDVPKSEAELRRERDDVARAVEPVFRFTPQALDTSRSLLAGLETVLARAAAVRPASPAYIAGAAREYGILVTPNEAAYLASPSRQQRLFSSVRRVFDRWVASGVAPSGSVDQMRGDVVLQRDSGELRMSVDSIVSFGQLVSRARLLNPDPESETGTAVYLKLITNTFRPTIVLERAETERRRDELRRSVTPNKYTVRLGEKIVGAHEVVGREEHDKLRALQQRLVEERITPPRVRRIVGSILFDLAILMLIGATAYFFRPRLYLHWRSLLVVAALITLVLVAAALVAEMRPLRPELIPVAMVAIVLSALFDQRIGMMLTMITMVLVGAQAPFRGTNALFINLVGGAVAALSVRAVTRRHHSYIWLLATAGAYLIAAIAIGLTLDQPLGVIAASAGHGALSALGSVLLALLVLPLAESYTGIETDLTLLEWSDLNRPLMQRLSLEAPGTFAHTMLIANLAEAGARVIGANALLARVGAYYHDIGKLGRPQYFVENQARDRNPHDALPPNESAGIIRDHVIEGLRLAEQYRVPKVLRAFITEHHGTGQISYFLDKAREQGIDAPIEESRYAYPGPVPRSAETAVVMLADGVEAAARVLSEPTAPRVREVVEHIVRQRLEQGQLSEAPLTMRHLELIKEEFTRVLTGMYHSRIDYPRASGGVTSEFASA